MKPIILLLIATATFGCSDKGPNPGVPWTLLSSGTNAHLNDLHFLSDEVGFIVGEGGTILKTTDGTSWSSMNSGVVANLISIFMIDNAIGFAVGFDATVIKTLNGGMTWQSVNFPETQGGLYEVTFTDAVTGFIATGRGKLYKTTDAGETWNLVFHNSNDFFVTFDFINSTSGFVSGGGGDANNATSALYKTTDGGETWQSRKPPIHVTINDIHFPTTDVGYLVGYENTVYKSIDNGDTWTSLAVAASTTWRGLHFLDQTRGFIVGEQGKIVTTGDGGSSWIEMSSGVNTSLMSIRPNVTGSSLYAVGAAGTILKYEVE